jgi:hypothetical protein
MEAVRACCLCRGVGSDFAASDGEISSRWYGDLRFNGCSSRSGRRTEVDPGFWTGGLGGADAVPF